MNFNPRTPCGVRRNVPTRQAPAANFNPRTPCGVRQGRGRDLQRHDRISIHAPRVGCDAACLATTTAATYFNPRTPCGVRRAAPLDDIGCRGNFNPRTPCGVRPHPHGLLGLPLVISIHAPRVGCDHYFVPCPHCRKISIHAPRVGCDNFSVRRFRPPDHFNPRTPCGVRRDTAIVNNNGTTISIHAPRVGCDSMASRSCWVQLHFNPRTPCGVRQRGPAVRPCIYGISIHAPRVGCDCKYC